MFVFVSKEQEQLGLPMSCFHPSLQGVWTGELRKSVSGLVLPWALLDEKQGQNPWQGPLSTEKGSIFMLSPL